MWQLERDRRLVRVDRAVKAGHLAELGLGPVQGRAWYRRREKHGVIVVATTTTTASATTTTTAVGPEWLAGL